MTNNKTALILSVGGTPAPLITSIKYHKPDLICFLYTPETQKHIEEILKETHYTNDSENYEIENSDSLNEAYDKTREIIQKLHQQKYNINVDFTGGTKTMVAGLTLATMGENCDYTYVGASSNIRGRDKEGTGTVQSGFELIKKQTDPLYKYAVIEFGRGTEFFNKYQFEAANENLNLALNKLDDEKYLKLSKLYIKIVNFYDSWDKFNNKIGTSPLNYYLKKEILNEIDNNQEILNYFNSKEKDFYNQIKNNILFLNQKVLKRDKHLEKSINYYLPDLLNNASRRIDERKFDDAVARLYRAIELIAQVNLNKIGLIDENRLNVNKVFHIKKDIFEEIADYNTKEIVSTWKEYKDYKKTFGIPLYKSYQLLKLLNIKIGENFLNDKELSEILRARNDSILAHGIKPISEEKTLELYKKIYEYAEKTCPHLKEYMELSKFPKFTSEYLI